MHYASLIRFLPLVSAPASLFISAILGSSWAWQDWNHVRMRCGASSGLGRMHDDWNHSAFYPLQALLFLGGSLTAISLLANFTFEVV